MSNTKFKVGDKVRVKGLVAMSDPRKEEYIGKEFIIKKLTCWNSWPYCLTGNAARFNWAEGELEFAEFSKSDLKDGMVIEHRDGDRYMVLGDFALSEEGNWRLKGYFEDLKYDGYSGYDIVKVYKVKSSEYMDFTDVFHDNYIELIWERKEECKEMTVEEIEKKLGYKIKVVGND